MARKTNAVAHADFDYIVDSHVIAAVLGLTPRSIYAFINDGMPQISTGVYDLRACVQWRIESLFSRYARDGVDPSAKKLREAQRSKIELELAHQRGELADMVLVNQLLASLMSIIATQLDSVGPRVAGDLVGLSDAAVIEAKLFAESRSIRSALAAQLREFAASVGKREADAPDDTDDEEDDDADAA